MIISKHIKLFLKIRKFQNLLDFLIYIENVPPQYRKFRSSKSSYPSFQLSIWHYFTFYSFPYWRVISCGCAPFEKSLFPQYEASLNSRASQLIIILSIDGPGETLK